MKFEIGDIVIPKTAEDLINEGYDLSNGSTYPPIKYVYTSTMYHECGGKSYRLSNIIDCKFYIEDIETHRPINWNWSEKMFRPKVSPLGNYIRGGLE